MKKQSCRKEETMSQIELCGLSKTYDKKKMVIEDVSLKVEEGEFIILVGPSGCGKSTLLRMIAGLESITEGILRIGKKVANDMHPKDRNISMVFQNYALYPHMTVKDNILFGLDVRGVDRVEREKRLVETAEMVGLTEFLDRKPGQLSGGQRQRVALARSICSHAPICLMDEPLSNLDAKLRGQMRKEIRKIQRNLGLTVVYVTHDQVEAMTMGDRIMVLNEGRIQQVGTPLELYNRPANRFVAGFIGSPQMNMTRAVMSKGLLHIGDSAVLQMSERIRSHIGDKTVEIGIRAEHILYSKKWTKHTCRVRVRSVEMMGNETQVTFCLGQNLFTARWQGQWDIMAGADILVSILPERIHFFDQFTGQLLMAPEPACPRGISVQEAV